MGEAGKGAAAFTLLELLMVVGVVGLLVAFGLVGYFAFLQSTAITTAANLIRDELSEARQDAVTRNMSVEVRLYALSSIAGEATAYRAIQIYWLKSDGSVEAANTIQLLPASIVIDPTADHSSLIATNTTAATPDASDRHLDASTRIIRFLPDGSADLASSTRWYLTVREATQSDPGHFPANWVCVELIPTTGRVAIYRP